MILSNDFGIDPGSYALKIFDCGSNSFYSEKNAIATGPQAHVLAWGEEAYRMKGSTPKSVSVRSSVSEGKIADVFLLESVIGPALTKEHRFLGIRPQIYFAVPSDMTEIERRAFASISKRGRLKNCDVFLIEKAYADALALGLSIRGAKGIMILNAGASQTTATVISNGKIILEWSIPIAGERFDEYILASIRKKNNLQIGSLLAEDLKIRLCDLSKGQTAGEQIHGIDTGNGLPRDGFVTARTVSEAVREATDELALAVKDFIHRIPPQVLEYIRKEGIYLIGGSARITGIDEYLAKRLKFRIILSDIYEYSTAYGLKEIIGSVTYKDLIMVPSARKRL